MVESAWVSLRGRVAKTEHRILPHICRRLMSCVGIFSYASWALALGVKVRFDNL